MSSTGGMLGGAVTVESVAVLRLMLVVLVLEMAEMVRDVHAEWALERTRGASMVRGTKRHGIGAHDCPQGVLLPGNGDEVYLLVALNGKWFIFLLHCP